ncbi:Lsr2 family protein [Sphaerisporangium album]|uniref:Lsr2 family protein n=1 Tax=Sphaerisporangium album TaxID=509200 RepID=A0A367EIK5_9ACTN|nr:Lsr2 family protein [Sphaerisporangium album]RCG17926.1 Lsr2 family protein [Sphaerisporangium album]
MATQIRTLLIDDLDGGEADVTVSFAIDGTAYEIDLNHKNAQQLRDVLSKFVAGARPAQSAPRRSGRGRGRQGVMTRNRSADIRAWAKTHGISVSERGRVASTVVEQYEAAH